MKIDCHELLYINWFAFVLVALAGEAATDLKQELPFFRKSSGLNSNGTMRRVALYSTAAKNEINSVTIDGTVRGNGTPTRGRDTVVA